MAKTDNLLFGTYVGLVVDVDDPDSLGRAKVLIPGKTGPLFQGWNNLSTDISYASVTPDVFSQDVLVRLRKTLPWARPAAPLWGGGTGSFNISGSGAPYTIPTDSAFGGSASAGGGVTPGVLAKTGNSGRSTGPHLDVRWGDKRPISAADADRYILVNGRTPSSFGVSSSYGSFESFRTSPHKGIDFRTPTGSDIQLQNGATFAGTFTDPRGGGTVVRINTPQGVMSLLHLSPGSVNSSYGGNGPLAASANNRGTHADGVNNVEARFDETYPVGTGSYAPTCQAVNPTDQYKRVLDIIKDKETYNRGVAPSDGNVYGVNGGTPDNWATFYTNIAGWESGGDPCSPFFDGPDDVGGSGGLYMLGRDQIEGWSRKYPDLARQYGLEPGRNYTEQELYNADLNTRGMLFIGDALLRENYVVGRGGIGRTIGISTTLTKQATYVSGVGDPRYVKGPSWKTGATNLVQRTTNQGVNAYGSANFARGGGPVGTFSLPAVGAKVWVMFEGGSPQRPVYFAQAYDPSNIGSFI